MNDDDLRDRFLVWRGVDDPCLKCDAAGKISYGNTATWRGGIGGATITQDICDACWGSGDRFRTGMDLRKLRSEEARRTAEAAVDLLARSVGAGWKTTHAEIGQIIETLEKLSDKRGRGKPMYPYLPALTQALANVLRRALNMEERKLP